VELKSIIDLYSSFKSPLGQKITKANLARMIVPFERQDLKDSEYPDTESSQQEFENGDKEILKETFLQIFRQRESKTQIKQKIKEFKLELHEIFQSLAAKSQADKRVGAQEFATMLTENLAKKMDPAGLSRGLQILISESGPSDLRMDFKQFFMSFTC